MTISVFQVDLRDQPPSSGSPAGSQPSKADAKQDFSLTITPTNDSNKVDDVPMETDSSQTEAKGKDQSSCSTVEDVSLATKTENKSARKQSTAYHTF